MARAKKKMRVRVVFRGLVLFRVRSGSITAQLVGVAGPVGGRSKTGGSSASGAHHHGHSGAHDHAPELQLIGKEPGTRASSFDVAPQRIAEDVHIHVTGGEAVDQAASFTDHVPNLSDVLRYATARTHGSKKPPVKVAPKTFTVTIDKGIIRAKDVAPWDIGANLLSGGGSGKGVRASAPAELKLLGSQLRGNLASECVIDIENVTRVQVEQLGKTRDMEPLGQPDVYASEDRVEFVFTNYGPRRLKAIPWGMDFQWLFHVAGLPPLDLDVPEFREFQKFAEGYDPTEFKEDWNTFMGGTTIGWPFPYVVGYSLLKPLNPLTDLWDRPLCVQGHI